MGHRPSTISSGGHRFAELSHQWFGDMVTPTWWNDIWIKESFAQETGLIIASQWRPNLDFTTSLRRSAFSEMDQDALPARPTGVAQRPR